MALGLLLVSGLGLGLYARSLIVDLPRLPENPAELGLRPGTEIYAAGGQRIFTFNQARRWVEVGQISPYALQALIATEDERFYHHRGIDLQGMAGALWYTLRRGYGSRGGSTLTQQLVKRLFFSPEKTLRRKASEILLALQLEALYARSYPGQHRDRRGRPYPAYKDRLLELYLNTVFYGANAYGIADAAETYFGLQPHQLSLPQAALLVGVVNAPTAYNPLQNPQRASARLQHVLGRMQQTGHLREGTRQRLAAVTAADLVDPLRRRRNPVPSWVAAIKEEVGRRWGPEVLRYGALRIHTTLDLRLQRAAEQAVEAELEDLDLRLGFAPYATASPAERPAYVQAALVCLEPTSGRVRAMVGGRDLFLSHYNRALSARRQPGSGFKPIAYLAALESGALSPLSLFVDAPRSYTVNGRRWSPRNYGNRYLGLTTAAWALVHSANSTAVQISERVGPKAIVRLAERLGFGGQIGPYRSIALGVNETTVLEMASAYGALAASGLHVEPSLVDRILDAEGRALFAHRPAITQAIDPARAYQVLQLLRQAVDRGTGRVVRRLGFVRPVAGKTGTTNDNTDAWFTGTTPALSASVWIGFDRRDGHRLVDGDGAQITGGNGAAPIWARFMAAATEGTEDLDFVPPEGIRLVAVDPLLGTLPLDLPDRPDPIEVALRPEEKPHRPAELLAHPEARAALPDSLVLDLSRLASPENP